MPAAPGHARASFDLKSANLPLIAVVLKTPNLAALAKELESRFGDTPDFFDHDPVVIQLTQVEADDQPIGFQVLTTLLRQYRMLPIGIHGGNPAQKEAAKAAGLIDMPDISSAAVMSEVVPQAAAPVAAPAPTPAQAAMASAPPATAAATSLPAGTMVIDKPLRSGQQVYARGSDLVVLSVVSFGAEIIADGSIHVYAPLRGRAIAGARGNAQARIFSTCLEPQLISIAGIYRTSEIALPEAVQGKPAQVRLVGESLVMEPL